MIIGNELAHFLMGTIFLVIGHFKECLNWKLQHARTLCNFQNPAPSAEVIHIPPNTPDVYFK